MVSRQADKDKTTSRVYKYGLVLKGVVSERAIEELWRSNKLWNRLVELEKANTIDFEKARCEAWPSYAEKTTEIEKLSEKIGLAYDEKRTIRMQEKTTDPSNPAIKAMNETITGLKKQRKSLYEELKPIRGEADKRIDKKTFNDAFRKAFNEACRVENSKIYSRISEGIADKFKTARAQVMKNRAKARLNFKKFDGTGVWYFRFRRKDEKRDGVSFGEIFAGEVPGNERFLFLSQDETSKKPKIRLRATLAGGGKAREERIFQEFDMIYHRPIPETGQIQNAQIIRSRIGDRFRFDVCFTVNFPLVKPLTVPKACAIGVDLNFRQDGNTVAVATFYSIGTRKAIFGHIKIPDEAVAAREHVRELQSELSDSAADLGRKIKPLMQKSPLLEDDKHNRLWRSVVKSPANVTLSYEIAYKLARLFLREEKAMAKEVVEFVMAWWKGYSRRYREMHNLNKRGLLNRKDIYRQAAHGIIGHKLLIGLEKMPLTVFTEYKDRDNTLSAKARRNRFFSAPSEMRTAIKNAAEREGIPVELIDPKYTSKTCYDCGFLNKALKAEKRWVCPACKKEHDRDENAARCIAGKALASYDKKREKAG